MSRASFSQRRDPTPTVIPANCWPASFQNQNELRWLAFAVVVGGFLVLQSAWAEQRFPPPDFQSGHVLPTTTTPPARALVWQYVDVVVLMIALALASWFALKLRSRKAMIGLSLFSLAYFGFYREGCICAIGAPQKCGAGLV